MRTAQARLMDSSLSRQTNFPLSIIPDRPLHRLTESMTRDLSAVVTSMLPALLTDSWLASEAYRRQMRRARKWRRSIPRRWPLHSTRRPRRGEVRYRRAELRIGRPAPSALCDDAGLNALAGVLRSSSARSRSINGTERCERRRAAIRALQQAVERFADATATKRFPLSRCASTIQIVRTLESIAETQPKLQTALPRFSSALLIV